MFEFATATRIIFGAGTCRQLPALAAAFGRHALVVTGRSTKRAAPILADLERHGVAPVRWAVAGEPTMDEVQQGLTVALAADCELVIAIGGGSAIDTGKAIAALMTNGGDLLDYVEVIGRGLALTEPPAPFLAVPTTAGTGAEVTRNAVVGVPAEGVKVSLRSPLMLPRVALVDPELTHDLPPAVTAHTGLDALAQLIEPYLSLKANPMTDAFCTDGIPLVARSLRTAYRNGGDARARTDMALASLFGGLALANAGLGAVHGFAAPIGGRFRAPHGAVCAALLPHVLRANVDALRARQPSSERLARVDRVAQLLTDNPLATADDAVTWLQRVCKELHIAPLGACGVTDADVQELVDQARRASSMRGNPIDLTDTELAEILTRAISGSY
jgi:alcohol dehydrogenase class IV